MINENINSFSDFLDGNTLYNIASGKAASEATANFLLNSVAHGEERRKEFIKEC